MIVSVVQRWRERRDSYRPAGELFSPTGHEVAAIADDTTAKTYVLANHYSASYPAARFRFGLYRGAELVGVAVFSQPVNDRTLAVVAGEGVELGRFVLDDKVAANGETWMLARCRALLEREGIAGVVSFSDPMPRETTDGTLAFRGHIGTIYQAASAVYLGRSRKESRLLLPDGTTIHNRALTKIRKGERGAAPWRDRLVDFGARPMRTGEGPRGWLAEALEKVTRRVPHPGNHKYVFTFTSAARRALAKHVNATGGPKKYPKIDQAPRSEAA